MRRPVSEFPSCGGGGLRDEIVRYAWTVVGVGELETGWATQRAADAARGAVDKGIRGRGERERERETEPQGGGRHRKAWLAPGTRKGS